MLQKCGRNPCRCTRREAQKHYTDDLRCTKYDVIRFDRIRAEHRKSYLVIRSLSPAHAHVLEAHGAHTAGVEDVLWVYDHRVAHGPLDAGEVEGAEFRPASADDNSVTAFGGGIGGITIVHGTVEFEAGVIESGRVVSVYTRALLHQPARERHGRRSRDGVCVRLERQAKHADLLTGDVL